MSQAAAAANTQMNAPAPADTAMRGSPNGSAPGKAKESSDSGKLAGVELITLETSGVGVNLRAATNEALKSAVSQVFGEQFASQSSVVDSVDTLSASVGDSNLTRWLNNRRLITRFKVVQTVYPSLELR